MDISENYAIVYFNYYRGVGNQSVVKELAISKPFECSVRSWVFQPPTKWCELNKLSQKLNSSVRSKGIYIRWEEGVTPYNQLKNILLKETEDCTHLISVNVKICELLANMLNRDVFNMEDIFPSKQIKTSTESKHCSFHSKSPMGNKCALMITLACTDTVQNLIATHMAVKNIPKPESEIQQPDLKNSRKRKAEESVDALWKSLDSVETDDLRDFIIDDLLDDSSNDDEGELLDDSSDDDDEGELLDAV